MPQISIIIPCYNQGKYIKQCLDSVVSQTFKDFEAIIINDASTDNSLKVIEHYLKKHSNMRLINQTSRGGVVSTRNRAIRAAKGTYIFPLDADDKISPNCLEKLYQAMIANKGDIISSRALYFGLINSEVSAPKPNRLTMMRHNCILNSSLFKKDDWKKSGGYDKAFNEGYEDYDFWLNLVIRQKCKIYRVPEILFYYRIKDISESRNKQALQINNQLIAKLNHKYPICHLVRGLGYISRKFIRFFYRGKTKDSIKYHRIFGLCVYKKKLQKNPVKNF